MKPSLRRSLGVLVLLVVIFLYVVLVAWFAGPLTRLPILLQVPAWLLLGTVWVLPLKPVIFWIETGRWGRKA